MDIFGSIGSFLGGLFGGNKKAKQTAAQLQAVTAKVDVIAAENVKQSKFITYLLIGFAVLSVIIVFFVLLKRRRG